MEVTADGDRLTLQFPDGWLAQHPLTAADLVQEQNLLRAGGMCLEFD
jgi:exopolyphosphatase/guanosine-5'-triphosphate,3'-diphosphate pyrophosphatase